MNTQELFNKMANDMYNQGRTSEHLGQCKYRDGKGNKCAVGMLIKDEFYESSFEDSDASCPYVNAAIEKSIGRPIKEAEEILLMEVQVLHDSLCDINFRNDWVDGISGIAKRFKLDNPFVGLSQ